MDKHLDIFVFGRVQGVGFRIAAKQVADNLGIKGYAKNEGKFVIVEAEGTEEDLDNFIEWCNSGTDEAAVERIDFKEGRIKSFREFSVI
ncbi:MAG TPA: acylphosphatase [Patescibacteria group bacterium]|nr:acylphosphatase [Patescibacteria group bacterium]